jgi:DNA-binding NtrC family response regulator
MRRILVVDDDPHISLAIRAWLGRYRFRVAIADGGAAGLVALDHSAFDLMIVDIFMAHMRGFESIRVFHDRAPGVPLIAISGFAFSSLEASRPDFLQLALRLGATRCLRKPFRPTTLLSVIDECLSEPEPDRRYVTTLATVADAESESSGKSATLEQPWALRERRRSLEEPAALSSDDQVSCAGRAQEINGPRKSGQRLARGCASARSPPPECQWQQRGDQLAS